MLRLTALVMAAFLVTGCGRRVTEKECVELLDRYTELLAKKEHPEASVEQINRMKGAARVRARHDPDYEFARCPAVVSRRQLRCAMSASDVDSVERCLVL